MRAIDEILRQGVERGAVGGIVALAATPDGIIYEGAAGWSDAGQEVAISADNVFWLLSLTKALTTTACLQLVEKGELGLDWNAGDILPALASPLVLDGFDPGDRPRLRSARRPVTIRHLLTHTAGYAYAFWNATLARYLDVKGLPDIGTCRNVAFEAPLVFDPGERWEYGMSTDWVGRIIEAVSGQTLDAYLRNRLLGPLGMDDTGFILGEGQRERLATLFTRGEDGALSPLPFEIEQSPEFFMGGGGAFGTPRDFMRFLRALLSGGALDEARILRADTVSGMFSNQIGDLVVRRMHSVAPRYSRNFELFPGQPHKWSLGFDLNEQPGPNGRSAGSAAWAGLLNCHFWMDPHKNVAGAIFTQTLPFFDRAVMSLYAGFERALYRQLA